MVSLKMENTLMKKKNEELDKTKNGVLQLLYHIVLMFKKAKDNVELLELFKQKKIKFHC